MGMTLAEIKALHEEDGIGHSLEADTAINWLIAECARLEARADRLYGWLEDIMQHASCDNCYAERKVLQAIEEDAALAKETP
jgi:hypothetical protein